MRQIEFRGKSLEGRWVYGDLIRLHTFSGVAPSVKIGILQKNKFPVEVIENTIGQYIGKDDLYGNKIFEGDVIKYGTLFVVEWDQYFFRFHRKSLTIKSNGILQVFPICEIEECEVIGNIHDNIELVEL